MKANADRQGDAQRMLCAITLQTTSVVEEILQARLYADAKMGREVILDTKTKVHRPLARNADGGSVLESTDTIVDMVDICDATNWQFQHSSC